MPLSHLKTTSIAKNWPCVFALLIFGLLLPITAKAGDDHDFSEKARKRVPRSYAVGAYFPTVGGHESTKVGTDFWSSYRYPVGPIDFRSTTHGQAFNLTTAAGSESLLTIQTQGFDALFRANAFYAGPGISFGSASANTIFFPFSRPWETFFTITAGFDFTTRIFTEVIWQAFGADPYRGVSISTGYRF